MENLLEKHDFDEPMTDRSQFLDVITSYMTEKVSKEFDLERFRADPTCPFVAPDGMTRRIMQRTRLRDLPFNAEGIIGYKTAAGAVDMIGAALHEARKEIMEQQANGDWVVAGWRIDLSPILKRERRERTSPMGEQTIHVGGVEKRLPPAVMSHDRLEEGMARRTRINVLVAFVDLHAAEELDMWELRTGKKDSTMRDGNLPRNLIAERGKAREIILAYHDTRPTAAVGLTAAMGRAIERLTEKGMTVGDIAEALELSNEQVLAYVTREPEPEASKKGRGKKGA